MLVPTTVLAEQHYRTFRERLAEYPFAVEVRQPFPHAPASRSAVVKRLDGRRASTSSSARTGSCRRTCKFKDLGLVIIDEEQRFGVEHKERLKQLRATVDVLTLTATPIPRTLHMSLLGIRDISQPRDAAAGPPAGRDADRPLGRRS